MKSSRTIWLIFLGAAACSDTTPPGFITEHLEVEPSDSDVVCRGSLDDMEAQIVRVAAMLDVDIPFTIPVYFGQSAVDKHCNAFSDIQLGGCARGLGEDTYVATETLFAYHELVHAVRLVNGAKGPRFYEEGIANVFSGFRPFPYYVEVYANEITRGPESLSMSAWSDFQGDDYAIAGHFMSWLLNTYGEETVAAFLNDARLSTATDEAFLDHFGLSVHEADTAWRLTSETVYQWGQICDPLRDLAWKGSILEFKGRIDCDASNTIGPGPDLQNTIRSRGNCFSLEAAGDLRVELVAPNGLATIRQQECNPVGPLSPEHFQPKTAKPGEALDLPFAPCTWEIDVSTELTKPIDFSLRLTRL